MVTMEDDVHEEFSRDEGWTKNIRWRIRGDNWNSIKKGIIKKMIV